MANENEIQSWQKTIERNNEEIEVWKNKIANARDGLVLTHHILGKTDGTKEDYVNFCEKVIGHYEELNKVFLDAIHSLHKD